jgi:hypothetical protein
LWGTAQNRSISKPVTVVLSTYQTDKKVVGGGGGRDGQHDTFSISSWVSHLIATPSFRVSEKHGVSYNYFTGKDK